MESSIPMESKDILFLFKVQACLRLTVDSMIGPHGQHVPKRVAEEHLSGPGHVLSPLPRMAAEIALVHFRIPKTVTLNHVQVNKSRAISYQQALKKMKVGNSFVNVKFFH
jgi:hypothetical protein